MFLICWLRGLKKRYQILIARLYRTKKFCRRMKNLMLLVAAYSVHVLFEINSSFELLTIEQRISRKGGKMERNYNFWTIDYYLTCWSQQITHYTCHVNFLKHLNCKSVCEHRLSMNFYLKLVDATAEAEQIHL